MSRSRLSGAVLALAIAPVRAAIDYMYVTDMPAYSALVCYPAESYLVPTR